MRPSMSEYSADFGVYISQVPESDILRLLGEQVDAVRAAFRVVSAEQGGFRYGPGKWSVREVFGHITDTERVLGYQALCVARGDEFPLASFDENQYANAARHDLCPLPELVSEFSDLRSSHIRMFQNMDPSAWMRIGLVMAHPTSTRAIAFTMAGHFRHHSNILRNRYGIAINA